jgi:acyl-coenzyme A synthetase/AMP-(fatty) acid ligase
MALAPAHALAHLGNTILGIYRGLTMGLYPPTGSFLSASPVVPTPENFLEHVKRTKCTGIITSPIFLKAWATSESDVKELKKLEHIVRLSELLLPTHQIA